MLVCKYEIPVQMKKRGKSIINGAKYYKYRTIDTHAIMKSQLEVCTGYGDMSRSRSLLSVSLHDWRVVICAKLVETQSHPF